MNRDAGETLSDLVTEMNKQLAHLPVGPERTAAMRRLAQDHLARAQTAGDRAFWSAFLQHKEATP